MGRGRGKVRGDAVRDARPPRGVRRSTPLGAVFARCDARDCGVVGASDARRKSRVDSDGIVTLTDGVRARADDDERGFRRLEV